MPAAPRVIPAEDQLLVLLGRYVRASVDQLTRHSYSPNSERLVRKYLNHLIELGYVDSYKGFSRGGNPPLVYVLSMQGWRYVERHHTMPIPARWKPSEAARTEYGDFLHDLAITDTGIAIERFCRAADPYVTFVQFLHDRFLPQSKIRLPDGSTPAIRLDGFVELHIRREETGPKRQRCHFIEIDRGTHYERALRKKFLLQLLYVQGGHYQREFGRESLSYLWICPGGQDRIRHLVKTLEATLREHQATALAPLFLFTSEDPATIDPIDLFMTPCWFAPYEEEPKALLTYPAAQKTISLDRSHYLPQEAYDRFQRALGEDVLQVAPELEMS